MESADESSGSEQGINQRSAAKDDGEKETWQDV